MIKTKTLISRDSSIMIVHAIIKEQRKVEKISKIRFFILLGSCSYIQEIHLYFLREHFRGFGFHQFII